jgi:hypothetical protein
MASKVATWQKAVNQAVKSGALDQTQAQAFTDFAANENRFKDTGVIKAINAGNFDKATERLNQSTDLYSQVGDNADLRSSVQKSLSQGDNKAEGFKNAFGMVEQYKKANAPAAGSGAEGAPPAEIPNNINQDLMQSITGTASDILGKAGDVWGETKGITDRAYQQQDLSLNPTINDAYSQDINKTYQDRLNLVNKVYGLDPNNLGAEGEKFTVKLNKNIEDMLNRGVLDSTMTRGLIGDTQRDYNQSMTDAQAKALDILSGQKDTERNRVSSVASNNSSNLFNFANANNQFGSNLAQMGLSTLGNANNMNLANLGFVRDTIENNFVNENNARLGILQILMGTADKKKQNELMQQYMDMQQQQIDKQPGFWSSFANAAVGGATKAGTAAMLP